MGERYHGEFDSMKRVFCYCDEGVDKELLEDFIHQCRGNFSCTTISAQEVRERRWIGDADLFVIPGGRDLPYVEALHTSGTDAIRDYVAGGGRFIGICAGAYFASAYVEFDKGGPLEVAGERALKFFSGKAIGPMFAPFLYDSEDGARILPVYSATERHVFHCYYNGGCFFDASYTPRGRVPSPGTSSEHEVLATYDNGLPAIVRCRVGKGVALLSGVHFERPLRDKAQEAGRKKFMARVLQYVFEP